MSISKKSVWMEVSQDKYQLPIRVGESSGDLARQCRVTKGYVEQCWYNYKNGKAESTRFVKVEMDEEEI